MECKLDQEEVTMATDLRIDAENKPGVLAAIAKSLGDAGVNIEGYCGVGNAGQGTIHVLVDDAAGARSALEGGSHAVAAEREALLIERGEDRPGYLAEIASKLGDAGINIEVGYVATDTRLVFVVDDPARAKDVLG
jgi:hypothetical protein